MSSVDFSAGNAVTLLHCGTEFFPALLGRIDAAATEILLETYLFATDDAAMHVLEALKRAADRGVRVNVITDWIGTGRERTALLAESLRTGQVNHRTFNRWFLRGVARTHRKICIIDRELAFVGGININHDLSSADGPESLPSERWDFAVMVRGPVVSAIHRAAEDQWVRIGPLPLLERIQRFTDFVAATAVPVTAQPLAAFLACDNLHQRFRIQKEYLRAIDAARSQVLIASPYFAPGRTFRDALTRAAARGVDVTLLLGVGQFAFQDWVARSYYRKLLASGVQLIEYRRTQLHAKVAVVDHRWATIGSSNCDALSLFVNHEANLVLNDEVVAADLARHLRRGIADGVAIDAKEFMLAPWYKRLWYGLAFMCYRMAMRLITFNAYA